MIVSFACDFLILISYEHQKYWSLSNDMWYDLILLLNWRQFRFLTSKMFNRGMTYCFHCYQLSSLSTLIFLLIYCRTYQSEENFENNSEKLIFVSFKQMIHSFIIFCDFILSRSYHIQAKYWVIKCIRISILCTSLLSDFLCSDLNPPIYDMSYETTQ